MDWGTCINLQLSLGRTIMRLELPKAATVNFAYTVTTLGRASEKCPYIRSLINVLQLDGTLLWAWKFCRYSRIVVISAGVICT